MALSLDMDASAPFDRAKSSMAQTYSFEEGLGGFSPSPPRNPLKSGQVLKEVLRSIGRELEAIEIARKRSLISLEGIDLLQRLGLEESAQKDWAAYSEAALQKNRGVLYGDLYDEGPPSEEDSGQSQSSKERRQSFMERRQFFASVGSAGELKDFLFNIKLVVNSVVSRSTSTGFLNISVSEEFRSSLLGVLNSRKWEEVESMVMPIAAALPRRAAIYEAFIVLASLLLSAIFQYLMALVDKGGTKTHSSGSRGFRSRYTCTILFLGAYVWIKFREVAPEPQQKHSPGLYRKCKVNELGERVYFGNYEPRVKPPGFKSYISVGSFEKEEDAKIMHQILSFICGKAVPGELPLRDGSTYRIPCMTEEEKRLDSELKKQRARDKAKAAFEDYGSVLKDSHEVQATEIISNNLPPYAGAGCDAQPVQLGNQSGALYATVCPRNSSPYVDPGSQVYVTDDSLNDPAAAATAAAWGGVIDEPLNMEELLASFTWGSQEVQGTGYISNDFPPSAGAGAGQFGNQCGHLTAVVPPSNSRLDVDREIPISVADDPNNDHTAAAAAAGVGNEPPRESHYQHHASEENQANNVNPDYLSVLRLLKLQKYQIQQLETQIQQLVPQVFALGRKQQQQQFRISELESEAELGSTKRLCVGDDLFNHAAAGAATGVSDEPPQEPHYQNHASEENQATNVNPSYASLLRILKLQKFRIQQLESQNPELVSRVFALERNQQQQQFRISELESEAEFRSSKRLCVADGLWNDHAAAAATGVSNEPPGEAQYQHYALEENQANNLNPYYLSVLRPSKLQQFQIQQLETQSQQLISRVFALERKQQQQQFRISELESEAELRSTKRYRVV